MDKYKVFVYALVEQETHIGDEHGAHHIFTGPEHDAIRLVDILHRFGIDAHGRKA